MCAGESPARAQVPCWGVWLWRPSPRRQPRPQAADTLRGYFTANPGEYQDLRGILAPIGDKQSQCNVAVLPPELASAYDQFMVG